MNIRYNYVAPKKGEKHCCFTCKRYRVGNWHFYMTEYAWRCNSCIPY